MSRPEAATSMRVGGKMIHPRYPDVKRAEIELNGEFLNLYPEGSVLERICMDVCMVEMLCLRASEHPPVVPPRPWQASAGQLWDAVVGVREKHGLTWGETARMVHYLSSSWLNAIVAWERHGPDSEKKADEA